MGCGSSKTEEEPPHPSAKFLSAQPALSHGFYGNFPQKFNLYFTGRKTLKKADFFVLTSDNGGIQVPLYAVTFHTGTTDLKLQTTLYSGTERDSVPMATTGIDKWCVPYGRISLPSSDGSGTNRVETLTFMSKAQSQRFRVPVGLSQTLETFEWHGESMVIVGKDVSKPWSLVRVSHGVGNETVAIWTELAEKGPSGEIGSFEFHGSGASGELGEYWKLVSVISFLWILQQRYSMSKAIDGLVGVGGLAFMGIGVGIGMGV